MHRPSHRGSLPWLRLSQRRAAVFWIVMLCIVAAWFAHGWTNSKSRASLLQIQNELLGDHRDKVVARLYSHTPSAQYLQSLTPLHDEDLAVFTKEAQRWIWERQNPSPELCHQTLFMVDINLIGQGLGSCMHYNGNALAKALQHGRIYLRGTLNQTEGVEQLFVDQGCGRNQTYSNFDCLFQPVSTCDASHLNETNYLVVDHMECQSPKEAPWDCVRGPEYWESRLKTHYAARGMQMRPAFFKQWWKAQAAAYLMRLNQPTADALRALRLDDSLHVVSYNGEVQAGERVPFPLPPGTVSMHVRHGDKHKEMRLVPFEDYAQAAEKFVVENPLAYGRVAFVSSEDPEVIQAARTLAVTDGGTAPDSTWVTYTSEIPRENSSPFEQLEAFGKTRTTLTWLLQLYMALECDVYVGTRGSNWNRLIDELRCVTIDKCPNPFLEVGPKEDWIDYMPWT